MAKGDDIQERLINFAVEIIKLCSKLAKTRAGNHVAGQLLRCGTSGRRIVVKQEERKAAGILFISWGLYLKN